MYLIRLEIPRFLWDWHSQLLLMNHNIRKLLENARFLQKIYLWMLAQWLTFSTLELITGRRGFKSNLATAKNPKKWFDHISSPYKDLKRFLTWKRNEIASYFKGIDFFNLLKNRFGEEYSNSFKKAKRNEWYNCVGFFTVIFWITRQEIVRKKSWDFMRSLSFFTITFL